MLRRVQDSSSALCSVATVCVGVGGANNTKTNTHACIRACAYLHIDTSAYPHIRTSTYLHIYIFTQLHSCRKSAMNPEMIVAILVRACKGSCSCCLPIVLMIVFEAKDLCWGKAIHPSIRLQEVWWGSMLGALPP